MVQQSRSGSLTVNLEIKQFFFDRELVIQQVSKKKARALSKIGAFVRRSARSSLRRRKRTSEPGKPPSVHSSDKFATLKNILFGLDDGGDAVVIGPVRLPGAGLTPVPAIHEQGRVAMFWQGQTRKGEWATLGVAGSRSASAAVQKWRSKYKRPVRRVLLDYPARPFMQPALELNVKTGTLPKAFK